MKTIFSIVLVLGLMTPALAQDVAQLKAEIVALKAENQKLKEEINKLKGVPVATSRPASQPASRPQMDLKTIEKITTAWSTEIQSLLDNKELTLSQRQTRMAAATGVVKSKIDGVPITMSVPVESCDKLYIRGRVLDTRIILRHNYPNYASISEGDIMQISGKLRFHARAVPPPLPQGQPLRPTLGKVSTAIPNNEVMISTINEGYVGGLIAIGEIQISIRGTNIPVFVSPRRSR